MKNEKVGWYMYTVLDAVCDLVLQEMKPLSWAGLPADMKRRPPK